MYGGHPCELRLAGGPRAAQTDVAADAQGRPRAAFAGWLCSDDEQLDRPPLWGRPILPDGEVAARVTPKAATSTSEGHAASAKVGRKAPSLALGRGSVGRPGVSRSGAAVGWLTGWQAAMAVAQQQVRDPDLGRHPILIGVTDSPRVAR